MSSAEKLSASASQVRSCPRDAVRAKLAESLRAELEESPLAAAMEKAVFNHAIHACRYNGGACNWANPAFYDVYRARAVYVMRNAAAMRDKALSMRQGSTTDTGFDNVISDIIVSRPSELKPELWKKLIDDKRARDELYGIKQKANTWSFRCKKCKNNECSFYEMQTRSADEPMTAFVLCLTCGNRWRMG